MLLNRVMSSQFDLFSYYLSYDEFTNSYNSEFWYYVPIELLLKAMTFITCERKSSNTFCTWHAPLDKRPSKFAVVTTFFIVLLTIKFIWVGQSCLVKLVICFIDATRILYCMYSWCALEAHFLLYYNSYCMYVDTS